MRVACIDKQTKVVINVIEVENLEAVPEFIGVRENGAPVRKDEVEFIETTVGSVGDIYFNGSFYRNVGS